MKNLTIVLFLIVSFLYSTHTIYADVIYVEINGNDNNSGSTQEDAFKTLNHAILQVKDGDEIIIGEGVFTTTRELEWDVALTITGAGPEKTIIQAAEEHIPDQESVFTFSVFYNQKPQNCDNTIPGSLIRNLTIQHGAAPVREPLPTNVGGGIKNFANLKVENCIIQYNNAQHGGAIYNAGTLEMENSTIKNNHAFGMEGGVFNLQGATYTGTGNTYESNTSDHIDSGAYLINDFESGFFGASGTNGNYEGGLTEDSENFQIVNNPDKSGINPSDKVGRFTRDHRGHWWAYAWFEFEPITINETPKYLHIMVYKPLISNVCVHLKDAHNPTPGNNTGELVNSNQTKTNEWQDLVFEINTTGTFEYIEIKPDFVNEVVSDRLDVDIDIYFDNIIINDSPDPRIRPEESLGTFPLPVGTYGETPVEELFLPDEVNEHLDF